MRIVEEKGGEKGGYNSSKKEKSEKREKKEKKEKQSIGSDIFNQDGILKDIKDKIHKDFKEIAKELSADMVKFSKKFENY